MITALAHPSHKVGQLIYVYLLAAILTSMTDGRRKETHQDREKAYVYTENLPLEVYSLSERKSSRSRDYME